MTPATAPLCELVGVTRSYGSGSPAVRGVSLDVAPGEVLALVGPSGSGKTTLLTLIAGLLRPDAGTVRLFGEDPAACPADRMQQIRARRIGFVFQTFHLIDAMTAVENVALALRFGGVPGPEAHRRARALLVERGIEHLAQKKPGAMSQGEKQRVAIARATANHPDLILADEPTASLETGQGLAIIRLLQGYASAPGRSVVVATHDLRMAEYATRILRIEDGCVVADTRTPPHQPSAHRDPRPPCRVRIAMPADNQALFELVDSNPIVADVTYVTDRRPDFFGLHRLFPDSRVVVGEETAGEPGGPAHPRLESCCSHMAYEGRLGDRVGRVDHFTDLCRRRTAKVRGLLRAVLNASVQASVDEGALAITALVNKGNEPSLGILRNPDTLLPAIHAATFDLTEVVPLGRFPAEELLGARAVRDDEELSAALGLINQAYARHQLFRPLDGPYFARLEAHLPGFSRGNVWIVPGREGVRAAAIWYDPSPLFNVRVTRFPRSMRALALAMRAIHALTGALFVPPRAGEFVRTLHVQAMAHRDAAAGRALLRGVSNLTRELGRHAYAFMVDERDAWPVPNRVKFAHKSLLFLVPIPRTMPVRPEALARMPWYFNLTLG
jgi:putative ABC transport system ATP-binding protein